VLGGGFHNGQSKACLVMVILVLLSAPSAACQDLNAKIAEYMNAEMAATGFRGSILIAQGNKVLTNRSFPKERHVGKYPVGPIAKQFIAAAILHLQEEKELRLEDPVCNELPQCPEGWKEIKILDLLTQTDGIPNPSDSTEDGKITQVHSVGKLLALLGSQPLEFKAGERFRHGDAGYAVLSVIIERISGEPYWEYLKEHIFLPLGMRQTDYDAAPPVPTEEKTTDSGQTDAHPYKGDGFYSTVDDLYLWDRALYGSKIISEDSSREMFTPYVDGHGFGWLITRGLGRVVDSENSGLRLAAASLRRYPKDKTCIIVLSAEDHVDAERISHDLGAMLFGRHYDLPEIHHRIALDPKVYDSYVGRYELGSGSALTVVKKGDRLMIEGIGRGSIEIIPESRARFFVKGTDSEVSFVTAADGNTVELILEQGGWDTPVLKTTRH
jgi:CubicO group peptidase (beta-lactamase class C family)